MQKSIKTKEILDANIFQKNLKNIVDYLYMIVMDIPPILKTTNVQTIKTSKEDNILLPNF